MKKPSLVLPRLLPLLLGLLCPFLAMSADDALPPNLGRGLDKLAAWQRTQPAPKTDAERSVAIRAHLSRNAMRVQTDSAGRVAVDIRLDGTAPAAEVKKTLAVLGLPIIAEHVARRADGRDGIISAYLPLEQASAVAKLPGVFSVLAAHAPRTRIGAVTSQGVSVLHADEVQASGYLGKGITIGVLSDSYDVATGASVGQPVTTNAAADVATGDLPGTGNPDGYTTPVYVLRDGSTNPNDGNTDEGRAMLQIIHDVAPAAHLAFCTAGETQSAFAMNIEALRTNPNVQADIITDDVGFYEEPFFSDSIVSQAVDDVVTSFTLAGHDVLYYSAAGNDGDVSYSATFTPVSDAVARGGGGGAGNLQLGQVPENLTKNGFHNFQGAIGGSSPKIFQKVTVSYTDALFDFQWDDPFLPRDITANYNFLVFDGSGNYRSDLSSTENSFSTGEAIQEVDLPLNPDGSDATYEIALSLGETKGTPAKRLRYILLGESPALIEGKYLQTAQPTLFGHSGAANADGIAAYDVHDDFSARPEAESYESFGPVSTSFDAMGNRFAPPMVRQQPTMAAVDGVDTTFFPEGPLMDTDSDNDGFPNFYGTSAAAPHAAGVAALLLQAAGGTGSLNAAQMRSLLRSTAGAHDLNPAESTATFSSADGLFHVSLIAQGDASDNSSISTRFFTLTYSGPVGSNLRRAVFNVGPSAEDFDESSDQGSLSSGVGGFPFTIGVAAGVNTAGISSLLAANAAGIARTKLSIIATAGSFPSGGTLSFGIDRDAIATGNGGNDADLLAGSTILVRFTLANGREDTAMGTLKNKIGTGYSPDVGYGLINADAALQKLLGQ